MTAVGGFRKWDIGAWLLQVDVDSLRKWSEMKKRYCLGVASSVSPTTRNSSANIH